MVYFDFDVFEPTLKCLEIIKPRLVKGSVVAFDELNDPDSPGETLALMKSIGLNKITLKDTNLHLEYPILCLTKKLLR